MPSAPSLIRPVILAALALVVATGADKPPPTAKPVDGAECSFDVTYVPPARLTGDEAWDRLMRLNLYVPKDGKAQHPVVMIVHGGAYAAGDMNEGEGFNKKDLGMALLGRGYAVVSLNYVLTPAAIFPQVFWDFRSAVRFLRANAARYRLDPTRVGAIGLSAGGWLTSSAGWTDAGDICCSGSNAVALDDLIAKGWTAKTKLRVLLPMDAPEPAYADQSARLNAISFDFSHMDERITPDDPATNVWVGLGFRPKWADAARTAGIGFSTSEVTTDKYKGQGVHVPPFSTPALAADGTTATTLLERIVAFMDEQLVRAPRTVAPEIRPNARIFAERAMVSLVAPAGAVIRYTTDGSAPTASSPVYDKPFAISADTVVSAICTRSGMADSGVAVARFHRDPTHVPPTITAPDTAELPKAKVGQPYRVAFTASGAGSTPCWDLGGRAAPYIPFQAKEVLVPLGLTIGADGVLSGTPSRAGRWWIQVLVAPREASLGAVRDYLLVVEP